MLPLDIFPGGGFDSSILTVVLLGLLAMWWLTETFGFAFVGLVVPGYLASVIIIAPTAAAVVVVESLVTYGIVWFLADVASRAGAWSVFFGRDRFFAFLLVSLFVRLVGELWLWPEAWFAWTTWSGFAPNLPGALTSVGLVLVPLAANMFWKVGLLRGIWQVGLPTLIVWGITTAFLLPWTNLRFAQFQVHYEDVAIDIIASPKAYVIMIVTAALAARSNIRFGWDFGGILIPALLAISWFDVTKGLVTLTEAALLAGCAAVALRSPPVRRWNLEGPRRIVFVFVLGYFLKYVLSWGLQAWMPHLRVTDFFGFGYLLSSLLALKILQRRDAVAVLVPVVVVSLAGFALGGAIVAALGLFDAARTDPAAAAPDVVVEQVDIAGEVVRRSVFAGAHVPRGAALYPDELEAFDRAISTLARNRGVGGKLTRQTRDRLERLGLSVVRSASPGNDVILLSQPASRYPAARGWGMIVLRPDATGPVLAVPEAGGDPIRVLAVLELARRTGANAVVFGARSKTPSGRTVTPRRSGSSPYHLAMRHLLGSDVIEVGFAEDAGVWIESRLEADFPLAAIIDVVGDDAVRWERSATPPIQRAQARGAWLTVLLNPATTYELAGAPGQDTAITQQSGPLVGRLDSLLTSVDRVNARSLLELGEPIGEAEHAAVQRAVLAPLLRLSTSPPPIWVERDLLRATQRSAQALGLVVERLQGAHDCWWIVHDDGQPPRGWGVSALRCDGGSPAVVLVPFPLREMSTWRFGAIFAEALGARSVSFGAIARGLETRPRGDPLRQPSLVTATQRAVVLEHLTPDAAPAWTFEVRGLSATRDVEADVLLAHDTPLRISADEPLLATLRARLERAGLTVDAHDGRARWASLRGLHDVTWDYANRVADGRFVRLWLSAPFRDRLSPSPRRRALEWIAVANDLASVARLEDLVPSDVSAAKLIEARSSVVEHAQQFARNHNPLSLRLAIRHLNELGVQPALWVEPGHDRAWLVTRTSNDTVFGVRLNRATPQHHQTTDDPLAVSASSFELEGR